MYPRFSENDKITVTEDYFVMDDGVKLYTRIAVPKGVDRCPVVFMRTPYEKAFTQPFNPDNFNDEQFFLNGYAIVFQHTRGRGNSEGECDPYNERDDGLCSLRQIRELPFYNGEIYLFGGSYLATVHLCCLDPAPEGVKGACLCIQTDRMYYRNFRNGCNYSWSNISWWLSMLDRRFPHQAVESPIKRPYKDAMKRIVGEDVPEFTGMLTNTECNEFWTNNSRENVCNNLTVPVLFVEGWVDFYIEGMFSMWERLPDKTKEMSSMIVGPWGHGYATDDKEFPKENGNIPLDFSVKWFDHIRKGEAFPYAKLGKVNYYSIGGSKWCEADFPKKPAGVMRLYFNKKSLESTEQTTGKSTYTYNPDEPLNYFNYHTIKKEKPVDICRGKLLSFDSMPFEKDTDIYGNIRWHIAVSTDCEDTAFFIRVYLVKDGDAYNLTETITSLSHICPDYVPGEKCIIDLKLPPIGFTVKKGVSIRAVISSDGGIYVPHANVKGHWAEVTETKIARNTIYMEDSYIELPIV